MRHRRLHVRTVHALHAHVDDGLVRVRVRGRGRGRGRGRVRVRVRVR